MIVLLQRGKGADLGAAFGGSSQTVFGSQGAGGFLTKVTTAVAVLFMFTSLGLAYLSSHRVQTTVMGGTEQTQAVEETVPSDQSPFDEESPAEGQTAPVEPRAEDIPQE
jgi:preprotein translocase subunit SecG